VKRATIPAAIVSILLLISLFGCGQPAQLKTITLTASTTSTGGFYKLAGEGGTIQLVANGNYGNSASESITDRVTYTVTPTGSDLNGLALPAPPQTMTVNTTGLVTAVPPFACSYSNVGTPTTPAYVLTGSYQIVATASNGAASQPLFVGIASAVGNGPSGACGP
jgi:hypothetical protein